MATTKKASAKKSTSARNTIAPNDDKRYIRRNEKGQITESDDVGKSLSRDVKTKAKKVSAAGQGDKGDQQPGKTAAKKK